MSRPFTFSLSLPQLPLWEKLKVKRAPLSFDLEITARCNNNCRHCQINLPAGDHEAKAKELSFEEILGIAREAVSLGSVWCLLTGGEPLLREDFIDLYLGLKRLGLLVSVFTNACLITREHVALFKKYPPRDIEVTVYGVTAKTYERVTRRPGSFDLFQRGLSLLLSSGVKVRLKAMALRANVHELPKITKFCRQHSKDYYRFDPFLHLRYDGNVRRNEEIRAQRLAPEEVVALEEADPERWRALKKTCAQLRSSETDKTSCDQLFLCGAGLGSFAVSYDGLFRLCPDLWHPKCMQDLREGNLTAAWEEFTPRVRELRSQSRKYLETCHSCQLFDLCFWCPGRAHLETGHLDVMVEYYCLVTHARVRKLR